jgi:Glycosyltransferase family 87
MSSGHSVSKPSDLKSPDLKIVRGISRRPILLVLTAVLCAVGMWTYTYRVLIPHQIFDAAIHGRPRGNFSDLYPRWLGARELLLHGRNPYSAEISREIQAGYYGRPLDPSRPDDPTDQQGFAYPIYVVFCLAPTITLPFAIVQKSFFWLLVAITCASILLWLRILRWSARGWSQLAVLAFTFGSLSVTQALKLQQMSLLVAGLLACAITLLIAGQAVAAGILLALATIKPQLMVILVLWLALWTVSDWRRRYRLAVSFVATLAILLAASEWYLPHWIDSFWNAVREYQRYTGAKSVLDTLMGTPSFGSPWSGALELLAFAALMGACWRERRQPANSECFAFVLALVLAITILLVPVSAPYNQVLLIPGVLVLVKERRMIWQRGVANRLLLALTACLIVWPWISSMTLAGLSFILPPEMVERVWAIPTWTQTQIPVAVAALMLLHYYQRTFTAPAKLRTS